MATYILKRLLYLVPILFTVTTIVFFLIRLIPGDPIDFILGENATTLAREQLASQQNWDQPLWFQYTEFLTNVLQGNWGTSYYSDQKVWPLVFEHFQSTLYLAGAALFWVITLAIPLGIYAALKQNKFQDHLSLFFSLSFVSLPNFYLGPLFMLVFAIEWGLLPLSGNQGFLSVVLPSLTLGLSMAAIMLRITRAGMIETLEKDFIKTAYAKGLAKWKVVGVHALKASLIPVVAILGLQFGALLTGTVVTEKIFNWPGIGQLLIESIFRRDYAITQGCILLISFIYVVVNFLTDIAYTLIDPRVKLSS